MKLGLTSHSWSVGLRGLAGLTLGVGILLLPSATLASLVLLFALYISADGALAILIGVRQAQHGESWQMPVMEGVSNIAVAGGRARTRRAAPASASIGAFPRGTAERDGADGGSFGA
jgi:uncharacterized membrane protein HdeD (DUF308 family)